MKTSLVQISPAGDWHADVQRIRGGPQGRVIVVWPDKGGPRSPRLVLNLMARRSRAKRVPLAVVAGRQDVRALATSFGLPLFNNARQARGESWKLNQPPLLQTRPARPQAINLRALAEDRRNKRFASK